MSDQQVAQGKNEHPAPLDEAEEQAKLIDRLRAQIESCRGFEWQELANDLQAQLAAAREETAEYAEKVRLFFETAVLYEGSWHFEEHCLGELRDLAANPPNGESALKRAAKLEAALRTIERSGHGLDGYESVEEERDYWVGVALRQRDQARAALAETAPEEPK